MAEVCESVRRTSNSRGGAPKVQMRVAGGRDTCAARAVNSLAQGNNDGRQGETHLGRASNAGAGRQ